MMMTSWCWSHDDDDDDDDDNNDNNNNTNLPNVGRTQQLNHNIYTG